MSFLHFLIFYITFVCLNCDYVMNILIHMEKYREFCLW